MILIDTNIVVALIARKDVHHQAAFALIGALGAERLLIPATVLTEMFFLLHRKVHYRAAVQAVVVITRTFEVADLLGEDYQRMAAIMSRYAGAKFDFADAAIMALSERLGITRVATLDRRDFGLFRPSHCDALELLPS